MKGNNFLDVFIVKFVLLHQLFKRYKNSKFKVAELNVTQFIFLDIYPCFSSHCSKL